MHADLEGAGDCGGVFGCHASEVFGEAVEGLSGGVVAEQNAMLEVWSRELVAQGRCEPDSWSQDIDYGACF